MTADRVRNYGK